MNCKDRQLLQSLGICPKCEKNSIMGNEKVCPECRAIDTNYKMIKYQTDAEYRDKQIKAITDRRRERRKERLAKGLCSECGKYPHLLGVQRCAICTDKRKKKRHDYKPKTTRKEWVENNLCFLCGKPNLKGYKVCQYHHDLYMVNNSHSAKNHKWKEDNKLVFK